MPRTRRDEAPVIVDEPVLEGRYVELADFTVAFESHKVDMDPAPLFQGLPDDQCPCSHWGIVESGKLTIRYPDHDETYVAGDAYYILPGHLPLVYAGSSLIEFTRTDELQRTMAVIGANMAKVAAH